MNERVLVVGCGAREHALAYRLSFGSQDDHQRPARQAFVVGGNAGIAKEFECIQTPDLSIDNIVKAAQKIAPDLVVIGPEGHLAEGLVDALTDQGIKAFGPNKSAAMLEISKSFTKDICKKSGVKSANFKTFEALDAALSHVAHHPHEKMVIKVDDLCAGKGVRVCHSKQEAMATLVHLFKSGGFLALNAKRQKVIIEEFLSGFEVSVFAAASGLDVVLFSPMQDYKRLNNYDCGPNTGGMGAIGPLGKNSLEKERFLEEIKEKIFLPVLRTMKKEGRPFFGLLYAGLMLTKSGPNLLEFNVRFGDPETQALLFGTKVDIYPLLLTIAQKESLTCDVFQKQLVKMQASVSIVLASEGYPFMASKPEPLVLPKTIPKDTKLFFGATDMDEMGNLRSSGGRVLNVVARKNTIESARRLGYELVREIKFSGMQHRADIGTNVTALSFFN